MSTLVRFFRLLPARLDLEWMRWARAELPPTHPDLPYVMRRISHLEDVCRG